MGEAGEFDVISLHCSHHTRQGQGDVRRGRVEEFQGRGQHLGVAQEGQQTPVVHIHPGYLSLDAIHLHLAAIHHHFGVGLARPGDDDADPPTAAADPDADPAPCGQFVGEAGEFDVVGLHSPRHANQRQGDGRRGRVEEFQGRGQHLGVTQEGQQTPVVHIHPGHLSLDAIHLHLSTVHQHFGVGLARPGDDDTETPTAATDPDANSTPCGQFVGEACQFDLVGLHSSHHAHQGQGDVRCGRIEEFQGRGQHLGIAQQGQQAPVLHIHPGYLGLDAIHLHLAAIHHHLGVGLARPGDDDTETPTTAADPDADLSPCGQFVGEAGEFDVISLHRSHHTRQG